MYVRVSSQADKHPAVNFLFCVSLPTLLALQNQAEAHYKGHKHARKLKAMESQKNRQRRAGERERERERERGRSSSSSKTSPSTEAAPLQVALMDTSLAEGTSK